MSNFRPPATPVFESGRIEHASSSSRYSNPSYGVQRSMSNQSNSSNMSTMSQHRVVREETDNKGQKVQLVRSIPEETESTQEIVDNLFQKYTYNYGGVRANQ